MSPELDKKLCEDFPELFRDRHGDMRTTAMCWGFSCGDGWEPLIRSLCETLMSDVTKSRSTIKHFEDMISTENKSEWSEWTHNTYTNENLDKHKQRLKEALELVPIVVQVKEKFGGLRFYVHSGNDKTYDAIHHAERLSYYICEQCSMMKGTMSYQLGWISTLCPACADAKYGSIAADFRNKTGEFAE